MSTTTTTRAVRLEREFSCAPALIWRCLTDETELSRWYPQRAAVDPGVGGVIESEWPGGFVTAEPITAWEPERLLATRWEDPLDPERSLDLSWHLEPTPAGTRVTLTHEGFAEGAEGEGLFDGCERGWRFQLAGLEHYLNRHRGQDREMVFLGQPTLLDRPAAWEGLAGAFGFAGDSQPGSPLRFGLPGDRTFEGTCLWTDRPRDVVAIWDGLEAALVRFQVDLPIGPGTPHMVYVFGSFWGPAAALAPSIGEEWGKALEEVTR